MESVNASRSKNGLISEDILTNSETFLSSDFIRKTLSMSTSQHNIIIILVFNLGIVVNVFVVAVYFRRITTSMNICVRIVFED